MVELEIDEWAKELDHLANFTDSPDFSQEMGGPVKEEVRQSVRDAFTSSASPVGGWDWPARKPRKDDDGHPLLIDTGVLLQAATGGGSGHIEDHGMDSLEFGVDGQAIPYAAVHNRGSEIMPQREYMGIKPEHQDNIDGIIADAWLDKGMIHGR